MITQLNKIKEKKEKNNEDKKPINNMIEYAKKKAEEEMNKLNKVKITKASKYKFHKIGEPIKGNMEEKIKMIKKLL
jgi:Tfp pilus assembly protein PilP